jgi:predicted kinase
MTKDEYGWYHYDKFSVSPRAMEIIERSFLMSHASAKGKLYITVGAARSGKSTFAQEWVQEHKYNPLDFVPRVIVDSDFIREAITGQRYCRLSESFVFATKWAMIRALLNSGHEVLCDDTATSPQTLKQYFEIDSEAKVIFINTSESVCIQRAFDSGHSDLAEKGVIQRMWQQIVDLANSGSRTHWTHSCKYNKDWNNISGEEFDKDVYKGIEKIREEVKRGTG